MSEKETDVLIVGAGPAGLALAADLGRRGVRCVVVERRSAPTSHPRATLLGARSMELYRRLGLAEEILAAGLPTSYRYEVVFTSRLSGTAHHTYASPSPDEYRRMAAGDLAPSADSGWSPYFKVQIGQHALEPVVLDYVRSLPSVEVLYGSEVIDVEETDDDVRIDIRDVESGEVSSRRGAYLAACDGGGGSIRKSLEVPYLGRGAMRRNVSYLFRSTDFLDKAAVGRANLYFIFAPGNFGVFTMIDNEGLWNYQHYVLDGAEEDVRRIDAEAEIRAAMGRDFEFEVLGTLRWSHHQSVAARFRRGRTFLVGDSAHLFCPTGGVGMNTAIGDAFDLSWKLWARLSGWGGEELLDSYERERWPVAVRNTVAGANNADRIDALMKMSTPVLEEDSEAGRRLRAEMAPRFGWLAKQFNSMGLHVGYRYSDSPVIVADGTPEPPDDPRVVVQSSWPGMRAPHVWLGPDRTTLDHFDGSSYVMVCAGQDEDGLAAWTEQAAQRGIPFASATVEGAAARAYELPFVLVRPDGHVCWRGESLDVDVADVLATVTGTAQPATVSETGQTA